MEYSRKTEDKGSVRWEDKRHEQCGTGTQETRVMFFRKTGDKDYDEH
jgi:hypothetical protein